jgi:hypothetical protein
MKLLTSLSLNQVGHPPGRPQRGAIAQYLGAFFESEAQLLQLLRQQPWFATGPTGFEQGLGSLFSPGLMPATDRLAVNPQFPGHLALTQTTVEESGRFESSALQTVEIAFYAFWIAHAQRLARETAFVTIFYEHQ